MVEEVEVVVEVVEVVGEAAGARAFFDELLRLLLHLHFSDVAAAVPVQREAREVVSNAGLCVYVGARVRGASRFVLEAVSSVLLELVDLLARTADVRSASCAGRRGAAPR